MKYDNTIGTHQQLTSSDESPNTTTKMLRPNVKV